jgi:ferredoxin-thioredoxin reductase catalytic subunit
MANDDAEKFEAEIRKIIQGHATESGCRPNPDEKTLDGIIKGLVRRKVRFGEFYCPCRVVAGKKDEDAKKICPCYWHEEEVKNNGHCLCRLFYAG